MPPQSYEYRRESLGGLFRSFDIERRVSELMNRLGSEGWELVSQNQSWFTKRFRLVFKRAAQPGKFHTRAA